MQTETTLLEFKFRRKELGGGVTGLERLTAARIAEEAPPPEVAEGIVSTADVPDAAGAAEVEPLVAKPESFARRGWVWIPLSFIFLFLGVLLGFQAALSLQKKPSADALLDPYSLALSVTKGGESLNIRWERQAPAIKGAQRGVLVITDGSNERRLELDPNQLQIGSVIYKKASQTVKFRLEVFTRDRTSVVETWEFKDGPGAGVQP